MKRYCFALDLKNDPELIAQYEHWHKYENGWPEVRKSIFDSGILNMEIYRTGTRLFMIMEVEDTFTLEKKSAMDANNPKVQEWEELMNTYQEPLPWTKKGQKWTLMNKIFTVSKND